jgi:magnesium chelatase subunit D
VSAAEDAALAALLFAVDPQACGGVCLRAGAGPARDSFLAFLRELLPDMKFRRVPLSISEGRLLGGLDLAATLRAGRPIAERGLLAEADGGVLLLAMAERIQPATAARLTNVLDTGTVTTARDGVAMTQPAHVAMIALDEGIEDERVAEPLRDRMAFLLDLDGITAIDTDALEGDVDSLAAARARLPSVTASDEVLTALCSTAMALGIPALRASQMALRVARIAAALAGRDAVAMEDAAVAARLVLSPRATVLPPPPPDDQQEAPPEPEPDAEPPPEALPPDPPPEDPSDGEDNDSEGSELPEGELVLEAAKAAIPAGLLAQLKANETNRAQPRSSGKAGAPKPSGQRGRPAGIRREAPGKGNRLNLVETLRAAAPWQRLRQQTAADPSRLQIRPDDFHVTRFKQRAETTTIFAVDASGSSAANRLAEAKGAVELLLADCYIRRDQVSVIAFRGKAAEILLPPTRSLVRAKRSLAGLPGGGGTPLAAGIDAAIAMADSVRRRGGTPVVVLLTDGRANVTAAGTGGRAKAESEAMEAASRLRVSGVTTLLVDTSPRAAPVAKTLAAAMSARYLPLPYADPSVLSRVAQDAARTR